MKTILKVIAISLLLVVVGLAVVWFGFFRPKPPPISSEDRAAITLMPLPAELKLGNEVFLLDDGLSHEFDGLSTPRLERAVERFYARLSSETGLRFGNGDNGKLILRCNGSAIDHPALGDDESYSIDISGRQVLLKAPAETGIIYGLETLLQLAENQHGQWVLPGLELKDRSRYPWRGLMIDVSRHWIPKEVILRNLDAMAAVKMNVLHWHLTDYQGFRVESKVFPALHEEGSGGDYYTQDDVREVVEYAADRGIRVVPEFDLPGHSTSWFVGYPQLASAPGPYVIDSVFGVLDPVMDPTKEEVYQFLDNFFGEMTGLFPDTYVHIGGDEVATTQWDENAQIRQFMDEFDLDDAPALQAYFNIRLQQLLERDGKKMMGWDEIIHPELTAKGIVVQSWRNQSSLWEAARNGDLAVLSAGYYLDHKQPAGFHYNVDPAVIRGAVTIDVDSTNWKGWDLTIRTGDMEIDGELYLFGEGESLRGVTDFLGGSTGFTDAVLEGDNLSFSVESNFGTIKFDTRIAGDSIAGSANIFLLNLPLKGRRSGGSDMEGGDSLPEFKKIEPLTREQEANILGGEACMWSEMVDSVTLESRVWPRAAAIAEKLWAPSSLTDDTDDTYRRLMILDDRLEQRGLEHRSYRESLLRDMVGEPYLEPLRTLVSVLQEDKFFNRMVIYEPELYTTTPLNRVVDAAPPESYPAYRFGREVDHWLESHDEETRARLVNTLESWASNHTQLAPAFSQSERLKEVEPHSVHLSELASLGLDVLSQQPSPLPPDSTLEALFTSAAEAYGGTILPVVGAVQKLVTEAGVNAGS
jgi:hexosaminidase